MAFAPRMCYLNNQRNAEGVMLTVLNGELVMATRPLGKDDIDFLKAASAIKERRTE